MVEFGSTGVSLGGTGNMEGIQFAGVKNVSGDKIRVAYDGNIRSFAKDEIKVLDVGTVQFLLSRNHLASDGKITTRKYPFMAVALTEALKHVKEPENESIAEAKKAAGLKEKEKAEWKAEVLAQLKADGLIKR